MFYHYLFICLTPAHLTYMNERTSEISAKCLLSGYAAEVLLHDSPLWMPPPFNGKHILTATDEADSSASDKLSCRNSPLQLLLLLLLGAEQVHWVSQLRDYYFNSWNKLVLQNWRLFHAPDKYEAIL